MYLWLEDSGLGHNSLSDTTHMGEAQFDYSTQKHASLGTGTETLGLVAAAESCLAAESPKELLVYQDAIKQHRCIY